MTGRWVLPDLDYPASTLDLAKEVMRQGEEHLKAQLAQLAQVEARLTALLGGLAAACSAAGGGALSVGFGAGGAGLSDPRAGGLAALAIVLFGGSLMALWGVRPREILIGGGQPREWVKKGLLEQDLKLTLFEYSEEIQHYIDTNRNVIWIGRGSYALSC